MWEKYIFSRSRKGKEEVAWTVTYYKMFVFTTPRHANPFYKCFWRPSTSALWS